MSPMETEIAASWQRRERALARAKLVESIWIVLVIVVPAGLGMAALARPAIQIVLEHGNGMAGRDDQPGEQDERQRHARFLLFKFKPGAPASRKSAGNVGETLSSVSYHFA
jgi:hypothetical protein